MMEAVVDSNGRVRLTDFDVAREWSSLTELAGDYLAYIGLFDEAKDNADSTAWDCVYVLTNPPAWAGAIELIDALLSAAVDENDVGLIAAGPLWDLMAEAAEAPRFIDAIEVRAQRESRWKSAVAGVWLTEEADPDVNRRLARFGAHYSDGRVPDQ